jgi:Flp pilus assembly protein TadD
MTDTTQTDQLLSKARTALDNGDSMGARDLFSQICRSDPQHAEAWLMYGAISGEMGNVEIAENALERAISIDPSNAGGHLALAHVLKAQGRLDESLTSAFRSVGADDGFVDAWIFIGAVAGMANDWVRAEEACNKAIALAPERMEVHANLGNVLIGTGRAEQAETVYRKALAIGESAEAWLGLGTALGMLGRDTEAEPALSTAFRMKPGDVDMQSAYTACIMRMGGGRA